MFNDGDLEKIESELKKLLKDAASLENKLQSMHQSAKRAGSSRGYLRSLGKLQGIIRWADEARKDFVKSADEHKQLVKDGGDSVSNQRYNYTTVNLNKLPIKKYTR